MSIKIASMNFGDCDTILHNTPNGMKNIAEVLGPNGEVYWSAIKELTGIPPLSIRSNGTMLLDYLISGNMSQTGTPTPTTPIQPQETGDKTSNLFDYTRTDGIIANNYINQGGTIVANNEYYISYPIRVNVGETYTWRFNSDSVSASHFAPTVGFYDSSDNLLSVAQHNISIKYFSFDVPTNCTYIRASVFIRSNAQKEAMLNLGSTALPYEPYGYKIPILSGGENLLPFDDKNFVITAGNSNLTVKCENGDLYLQGNAGEVGSLQAVWKNNFAFDLEAGTYYCNSPSPLGTNFGRYIKKYDDDSNIIGATTYTFTLTEKTKCYLSFYIYQKTVDSKIELMLNRGSTALPYEPYNRTTTPIYLGEVQTTRKIKKLVLDGTETGWTKSGTYQGSFFAQVLTNINITANTEPVQYALCSHAQVVKLANFANGTATLTGNTTTKSINLWIGESEWTVDEFKSYLATQYAAGTPVTIWYVLAEPTTGIVNEPLRKIGDYADTVSYEQAGVQIPTNRGNTVIDVETTLKPSQMHIKYK